MQALSLEEGAEEEEGGGGEEEEEEEDICRIPTHIKKGTRNTSS
jgi:hypothetical protein